MNAPADPPTPSCQQCGQPMAGDAPEGLCARCLLSAAIKEPSTPEGDLSHVPAPAELARFFPQFEILELLGRGGMGMVYKARQPQLDRIVALKILPPESSRDPQFAERFAREARALARLNHPNIVHVHDFGQTVSPEEEEAGLFYFVMEFVDGANLRQLMRAGGIAPEQALAIVPRICEALQFAHEEGVMHRDIKPENILVDKRGRVKIADFGLAKILGQTPQDLGLTQTGMSVGTPRYMAPEQREHPEQADHRADIYSLGVVFYEMLTGEVPTGRFALPSEKVPVDVRLDAVVLRSLEHDVARRYQHVSEVKSAVEDITGILASLPPAVRRMMGAEYRSSRTLFGLPLLHVAFGVDPRTGRAKVARGIVAIGDSALGVIALGGVARGVFAFGGVAIGGVAFGGLACGLVSVGGLALALLFAYGGLAVGAIAGGGLAIGYVAMGGGAYGVHFAGGNGSNLGTAGAFRHWVRISSGMSWIAGAMFIAAMLAMFWARWFAGTKGVETADSAGRRGMAPGGAPVANSRPPKRTLLSAALALLCISSFLFGVSFTAKSTQAAKGRTSEVRVGSHDPLFVIHNRPDGFDWGFHLVSWSAFALLVSGCGAAALLRIEREDSGKAPRDPAWWREWWKSVAIWGGLLLIACTVRSALNARASLGKQASQSPAAEAGP